MRPLAGCGDKELILGRHFFSTAGFNLPPSSKLDLFLKTLPVITSTLTIRASKREIEGDTNIQSVAPLFIEPLFYGQRTVEVPSGFLYLE